MASGRRPRLWMIAACLSVALGLWLIRYSYSALSDPIGFMLRDPLALDLRPPSKGAAWAGLLAGSLCVLWPFLPWPWRKKR